METILKQIYVKGGIAGQELFILILNAFKSRILQMRKYTFTCGKEGVVGGVFLGKGG